MGRGPVLASEPGGGTAPIPRLLQRLKEKIMQVKLEKDLAKGQTTGQVIDVSVARAVALVKQGFASPAEEPEKAEADEFVRLMRVVEEVVPEIPSAAPAERAVSRHQQPRTETGPPSNGEGGND